MVFEVGEVVAFKLYGDKRFPKANQYHRVIRVEGRGRDAQVFTDPQHKTFSSFFIAQDLRKLRKRERGE